MGEGFRGGQRQVLLLLKELREAGLESTLLAVPGSPLFTAAQAEGLDIRDGTLARTFSLSRQFEIAHAHDARGHKLLAMASRIPFVVSRRVAFPIGSSLLSRWKYRRPARFRAVSQFVAEQLRSGGVPLNKIDVVYDAVAPASMAEPWNASFPAVALATTDPQKGRDLVECAAQIAGIPMVFSENLAVDLRRASFFVYITRSEGLGSAALLAMAMGVPVIASKVEGLAEVFEHGRSGLYTSNSAEEIAATMRMLLDDPTLALRLVEEGKKRAELLFAPRQLLQGTIASYQKAMGQ